MSQETVLVSYPTKNIVKITLNRPQALNAINFDLLNDLTSALRKHAQAHVIILEGAGDRSFCAGEDLKQTLAPKTGSAEELRIAFNKLQDITRLTSCSPAIVVAAVQGYAIGGGAEIALAADFVVGGPQAAFKFPEVTLGHAVTGGISARLTTMVGLLKAKELLLFGRFVAAEEALKLGLLSEIAHEPKARALALAMELEKLPAAAASSSKTSLERATFPNMETTLYDEVNVASYCFAQADAAKAFSDFSARKGGHLECVAEEDRPQNPGKNQQHTNGVEEDALRVKIRSIKDINAALEYAAEAFPTKTFLRFGSHDVTFQDFKNSVSALAGGLRKIGVQPGDRVLVMMHNSVEMVHTWMATNWLGAIWVPINVELRSISLKHAIHAAAPTLAIIDEKFLGDVMRTEELLENQVFTKGSGRINDLTSLYDPEDAVNAAHQVSARTTSAFLYTSGTTGRSKPCILSHQYFILQATALIESYEIRQDDVLYCPFPLFHADATALTTIPAILLGATAALSTRYSASKFWEEIRETKATVYDFMGATLALTYKQPCDPRDREHNVRLAWGVPMPAFAKEYEKRFGHALYTLYGSVEASLPIMQQGSLAPGSCGKLRPGAQIRIANDDGEPVPLNTPGQLLLRSDEPNAFFHGYFNDPASTLKAFTGLWFNTGDIGKVDEDGNFYFLGRLKDVIRRRGENINASEVEEEFLRHPDVITAAAFAVPSELGFGTEDELKVAVKLQDGKMVTEESLWHWATQNMAKFQVPGIIEIVDEIKKTPTGKIEKGYLKKEGGKTFDLRRRT
ncbi:hypothetical protein FQN57_005993 [Myotisia sp. PD_48]|nr:hypothetical protein FQN57_005993 [Myotisia sp. PD_48]